MYRACSRRFSFPVLAVVLAIGCGRSSSSSGGGAGSIEELIDRFEVALASGDGDAIAALVNAPADGLIRDKYRQAKDVDAARLELDAALDKAFGPPPAGRTDAFGSPIAQWTINAMGWKKNAQPPKLEMTVKSRKPQADGTVLLTVDEVFEVDGSSKVKSETITVVETSDGWKLVRPKDFHPEGVDRFQVEKRVANLFRLRAREVADGLFKLRREAEDLTAIELAPLLNEWFLDSFPKEWIPKLEDEYRRLGVFHVESSAVPRPVPVPFRIRSAAPGKYRLEVAETSRDVAADALTAELKRSLAPAAAAAGGAPIDVTVLAGIPSDDLLKLFHSLVDLRPDFPQGLRFTIEAPDDLKPIHDRLGGRLKLLNVADRPYTIDLDPAAEGAPAETNFGPDKDSPAAEVAPSTPSKPAAPSEPPAAVNPAAPSPAK